MIDFSNLHVGLTNRCTLGCPECARNMQGGKYIHKMTDADTETFKKFLSAASVKHILFCGNWGDPIYSKNFLGLLEYIKTANAECSITIHTNGAFKSIGWWKQLMQCLGDSDRIIFSIDGVPENYTSYRRNSKWESVKTAIETVIDMKRKLCKNTSVEWKYLVFAYNEDNIQEAYNLSMDMGFNRFFLQEAIISENLELTTSKSFDEIQKVFYEAVSRSTLQT